MNHRGLAKALGGVSPLLALACLLSCCKCSLFVNTYTLAANLMWLAGYTITAR
jgi:hypothetical protein